MKLGGLNANGNRVGDGHHEHEVLEGIALDRLFDFRYVRAKIVGNSKKSTIL